MSMNTNRVAKYRAAMKRAAPHIKESKQALKKISAEDAKTIEDFEIDIKSGAKAQITNDYGRVIQLPKDQIVAPAQYWKFSKSDYIGAPKFNTLVTTMHDIRMQLSYTPQRTIVAGYSARILGES